MRRLNGGQMTPPPFDSGRSPIRDLAERRSILAALGTSKRLLRAPNGAALHPRGLPAKEGRFELVPLDRTAVADDARLHFRVHAASFELAGSLVAANEHFWMDPSAVVFSAERRRYPRLAVAGRAAVAGLGLEQGRLVNADPSGLQIMIPGDRDVAVGTTGRAEIALGDERFFGVATVRRCERSAFGTVLGLELTLDDDHEAYVRALVASAYPRMLARQRVPEASVLSMLGDAGYLKLTSGAVPDGWWGLESPETYDLVYRADDDALLAHLSVTRVFGSTWIFHQLAGVQGHAESFASRYAMYRVLSQVPTLMDGAQAFALAYFNPELVWHHRYVYTFTRWMGPSEDVEATVADRFQLDATLAVEIDTSRCVASPLALDDRDLATDIVRGSWSPLLCDALDITPETLSSDDLTKTEGSKLARTRRAFGLHRDGELIAVALAERGHPAMSLFGMFDIAHVLPRVDQSKPSPAELAVLIEHVRRWYAAQGIGRPILTTPPNTIEAAVHPALTFVEAMGRFVLNARGLRHYENFLHYAFGEYARAIEEKKECKA